MAESIRQPDELILCANIAENWRKFKQEFELYMLAAGHDGKPSEQKIALLLHVARKQAIEVYNTFAFSEEEEGEYESVIGKFDAYCNPKKNETYERYVFNSRKQLEGEAIEQFVTDLKLKAQTCQFDNLRDTVEPLTNDHPHQRPSLSYDHISCDGQWFLFVYESLTSDHPSYTTTPM